MMRPHPKILRLFLLVLVPFAVALIGGAIWLRGGRSVSTEDAYEMVYALGQIEGVLVGQSCGAALVAALRVARGLREGCVVTVFPDFGDKYLSTNLWIGWEQWRKERLHKLVSKWNASASATT